jgi:hypothetical protein
MSGEVNLGEKVRYYAGVAVTAVKTAYDAHPKIAITLLVIAILAAASAVAIHYTGGFNHFLNNAHAQWDKAVPLVKEFIAKQITVGDALRVALPIFGVGLVSPAIYSFGGKAVDFVYKKCSSPEKYAKRLEVHANELDKAHEKQLEKLQLEAEKIGKNLSWNPDREAYAIK